MQTMDKGGKVSVREKFQMVVDQCRKKMLPSRMCDECAEKNGYKIIQSAHMYYLECGECEKIRWTSHKDDLEKKI